MEWSDVINSMTGIILPVVAVVAVFTFIAVASWSDNRRKEREAYYRSETLRRAIEQGGESAQTVLAMMREEELRQARRRVEGLRLGGMITIAVGIGMMVLLYFLETTEPVWLAGLLPLLVGIVLAVFGFTKKPEAD